MPTGREIEWKQAQDIYVPLTSSSTNELLNGLMLVAPPQMVENMAGGFIERIVEGKIEPSLAPLLMWTYFRLMPPIVTDYLLADDTLNEIGQPRSRIENIRSQFGLITEPGEEMEYVARAKRLGFPPFILALTYNLPLEQISAIESEKPDEPMTEEEWRSEMGKLSIMAMAQYPALMFPAVTASSGVTKFFAQTASQIMAVNQRQEIGDINEHRSDFMQMLRRLTAMTHKIFLSSIKDTGVVGQYVLTDDVIEQFQSDPFIRYMTRFIKEAAGKYEQKSQTELGGTVFLEGWMTDVLNNLFEQYNIPLSALPTPPELDETSAAKGRGGDILLVRPAETKNSPFDVVAIIDVTTKGHNTGSKKPSGINIAVKAPTLVLYLNDLAIFTGTGKRVQISAYRAMLIDALKNGDYESLYGIIPEKRSEFISSLVTTINTEIEKVRVSLESPHIDDLMKNTIAKKLTILKEILEGLASGL